MQIGLNIFDSPNWNKQIIGVKTHKSIPKNIKKYFAFIMQIFNNLHKFECYFINRFLN